MTGRALAVALVLLAAPGCALLTKSEPLEPVYYRPRGVDARGSPEPGPPPLGGLRLRVRAAGEHLDLRLFVRTSDVTCGFDEARRWTERPSEYLRRALEQALFERGPWRRSESLLDPTLEVELVAFEEVAGARPAARVTCVVALCDTEGRGLAQRTVEAWRPLEGDAAEALPRAMGAALQDAVAEVAGLVLEGGPAAK